MTQDTGATVAAAVERTLRAYDALVELGEELDDEWSYVQDLSESWRTRLQEVALTRGADHLEPPADAAIDALAEEAARIVDPHRAIDWLSTVPQVALLALGEHP